MGSSSHPDWSGRIERVRAELAAASLDGMRLADAFLIVPAASEGHAAGSAVAAFPLRDET